MLLHAPLSHLSLLLGRALSLILRTSTPPTHACTHSRANLQHRHSCPLTQTRLHAPACTALVMYMQAHSPTHMCWNNWACTQISEWTHNQTSMHASGHARAQQTYGQSNSLPLAFPFPLRQVCSSPVEPSILSLPHPSATLPFMTQNGGKARPWSSMC